MYKLILADGTELKGFTKNGDNYITDTKVDEDVFEGNLDTLTVTNGEDDTRELTNAQLIQQIEFDGKYWLCFREKSEQEIKEERINSQIEYLAMMTDVDLEEV